MTDGTGQRDVQGSDGSVDAGVSIDDPRRADGLVLTAPKAGGAPYSAPRLRYLGKVAALTFGAAGSQLDGGTHTGHNHKVG